MAPFLKPAGRPITTLIAFGPFGDVYSQAFAKLGVNTVRGSRGRNFHKAGGYHGMREMLRALDEGTSVALTADLSDSPKTVAPGILALARLSGRPIIPFAIVSDRCLTGLGRWDTPRLALPHGNIVAFVSRPITVCQTRDLQQLEMDRDRIARCLHQSVARALEVAALGRKRSP